MSGTRCENRSTRSTLYGTNDDLTKEQKREEAIHAWRKRLDEDPDLMCLAIAWIDAEVRAYGSHNPRLRAAAMAAMRALNEARWGRGYDPLLPVVWPNATQTGTDV